jgi:hypothetical protein
MATTYQLISSVTVGSGGASSIDFTSIPSTYTDLSVVFSGRSDTNRSSDGGYAEIQFNNSTSNLTSLFLYNYNGTLYSGNDTYILAWNNPNDYTASTFSNVSWYISNYASTTINKAISIDSVTENNSTNILSSLTAGLWSSSSAITSIKIKSRVGNFVQYTTAYLYGISNA